MLPFAKGKEIVPVIFAKNVSNQSDTAIVITPEGIMDLMKQHTILETASKQQSGMCTFYTYHFALH